MMIHCHHLYYIFFNLELDFSHLHRSVLLRMPLNQWSRFWDEGCSDFLENMRDDYLFQPCTFNEI